MDARIARMKELVVLLNQASRAYYQEDREIMTNFEYDQRYDELLELEKETGTVFAGSPSVSAGYEAVSELPKERHGQLMLSLDKTKAVEDLKDFLGEQQALLSWKLDGLTIVLTYMDGKLNKAVTRGNGEIGEVVTNNAKVFKNLPHFISYKGELILRGEAVIGYQDFEIINARIPEAEAKYKNPRNLCSGSVRQLNNEITKKREVSFYAFALVKADGIDFKNSREQQLIWLTKQGFDVVEYRMVSRDNVEEEVAYFANKVPDHDIPSDGLVLLYDDITYGNSLGSTSKFPRNAMAFKWSDEKKETKLLFIEWSASRTGLINPVAIFEPVELEGTTVSRASVHNLSILKGLKLGNGDTIEVFKANMIIPQIAENLTRSGTVEIPCVCPVCNGKTEIRKWKEVETLYCTNTDCQAKKIKSFLLFVSRDALNMDGLSEATLEKFILKGFIKEYVDIFSLKQYQEEIVGMEGFGKKSCENLMQSIERSRHTTLPRVIYGIGIANVGLSNAKMLCKELGYDKKRFLNVTVEELNTIAGIGTVIAESIVEYFTDSLNRKQFLELCELLDIEEPRQDTERKVLEGKNFVITGSVERFSNRMECKAYIEKRGGKVTGSVSAKTDYLINNDTTSHSSKNKKAKELEIPILSEEMFLKMVEEL